jgi:hypothetical protein
MKRTSVLACSVLLSAACGSDPPAPTDGGTRPDGAAPDAGAIDRDGAISDDGAPPLDGAMALPETCAPRSGTRLRLRWLEGGGAAAVDRWNTFYDSELAANCSRGGPLGNERCVPDDASPYHEEIRFTDPGCTTRIARSFGDADPGRAFHVERSSDPCAESWSYSRVTGVVTLDADDVVYTDNGGPCVELLADPGEYYTLGEVLPWEGFVAMTPVPLAPRDGRIELQTFEGSDGSRTCDGSVFDHEIDAVCRALRSSDGTERCVPAFAGMLPASRFFVDAECTAPRLIARTFDPLACDPRPSSAAFTWQLDVTALCGTVFRAFAIGEPVSDPLYLGSPGSCEPWDPGDGRWHALGAEVDPTTLVPVTSDIGGGTGRLRTVHWRYGEALRVPEPELFFDSELDTLCQFSESSEAVLRCRPVTTASAQPYFTDAACTAATSVGYTFGPCAGSPPTFASTSDGRYRRIAGPYAGPPLYQSDGATCTAVAMEEGHFFTLGEEVATSSLVLGAYRTE